MTPSSRSSWKIQLSAIVSPFSGAYPILGVCSSILTVGWLRRERRNSVAAALSTPSGKLYASGCSRIKARGLSGSLSSSRKLVIANFTAWIKVTFPCNATRSRNHWDGNSPSGFCFYKLVDNFLRLGFIRCFWLGLWFRSWCGPWCYLRCWFGCGFYFRRCASVFVFLVACKGSN